MRHLRKSGIRIASVLLLVLPVLAAAQSAPPLPPPRQATPPKVWVLTPPPAAMQFRQSAQQQHLRDQLQKSQLESNLHQYVSDQSRRPASEDALTRAQAEQADQARRARDHAAQQDLLDRSTRLTAPPPVPHLQPVPEPAPASTR